MQRAVLLAVTLALAAPPAFAQSSTTPATPAPHRRAPAHRPVAAGRQSNERPIDLGPNTPEANRAYQGGGVILQSAPGGPPPVPQPTPPGQTPVGSVPIGR